jgi:hypothetical protein
MPECPNCRHKWTEIRCAQCDRPMGMSEAVTFKSKLICGTCAAREAGDRRRSYEVKTGAPKGT